MMDKVIEAARLCGIHERILALPDGYNTVVDDRKIDQPAGFIQLVCLARAVFSNPSIVVLDEPTANLDHEGEQALIRCLQQLRLNGTTVLVATHRANIVQSLNKRLVLNKGVQMSFEDTCQAAPARPQEFQQNAVQQRNAA